MNGVHKLVLLDYQYYLENKIPLDKCATLFTKQEKTIVFLNKIQQQF